MSAVKRAKVFDHVAGPDLPTLTDDFNASLRNGGGDPVVAALVAIARGAAERYGLQIAEFGRKPGLAANSLRIFLRYQPGGPGHVDVSLEGDLAAAAGLHGALSTVFDRAFSATLTPRKAGPMNVSLSLLVTAAGAALGESLHLAPDKSVKLAGDLQGLVVVASSNDPDKVEKAVEAIAATLSDISGSFPQATGIVNAAKIISEFGTAKHNFETGQAVVLAHPTIEGRPALVVVVEKGGAAAEALGV